jgi:hypothetical protein
MAKMPPEMRDWREGTMDELIGRLVANVGIDRAAAAMAVGIILDFVAKEGPPDKAQSFLAKLPGADALGPQAAGEDAARMGGVMGAGLRMMGTGLSIGAVQSVTQQFVANAREKVGEEEEVSEFVAAIPGLAQFV